MPYKNFFDFFIVMDQFLKRSKIPKMQEIFVGMKNFFSIILFLLFLIFFLIVPKSAISHYLLIMMSSTSWGIVLQTFLQEMFLLSKFNESSLYHNWRYKDLSESNDQIIMTLLAPQWYCSIDFFSRDVPAAKI